VREFARRDITFLKSENEHMAWWIWAIGGLLLLCAEVFVPIDFYLVFLGFASLITSLLVFFGILETASAQWIACGVFALALLLSVRRKVLSYIHATSTERAPEFEGEIVTIRTDIPVGGTGKGEARGTVWSVRNESAYTLLSGKQYRVARCEGLSLVVQVSQ
jgi:membrane protein implicated in regulation of membrane protease activity